MSFSSLIETSRNDFSELISLIIDFKPIPTLILLLSFRANTLLSRSLDKFQRLYCVDWVDSSIGSIVRRICEERVWLETDDTGSGLVLGGERERVAAGEARSVGGSDMVDTLRKWCVELWDCIYATRHQCPP